MKRAVNDQVISPFKYLQLIRVEDTRSNLQKAISCCRSWLQESPRYRNCSVKDQNCKTLLQEYPFPKLRLKCDQNIWRISLLVWGTRWGLLFRECEAAKHSDAPEKKKTSLRASSKNISSKSSVFFIMCFLKGSFYKGSVFFFLEKITTRRYTERAVLLGVSSSIRGWISAMAPCMAGT